MSKPAEYLHLYNLGKRGGEADQPLPLRRLAGLQRAQGENTHKNDFLTIRESVPRKASFILGIA